MSASSASIIITNYNYGRFLERCIDSALAQTHPNTEVVVVDDASQDNSREIIRKYGNRVVPVLQERNCGQGASFNAGFHASSGDVVFFLDADDTLCAHALDRVLPIFTDGVTSAQFRLRLVDGDGFQIDLYPAPEIKFDSGDVLPILLARGRYENTVTSGNAFARSTLSAILPMPEQKFRICADGYLLSVAPFFGKVVSLEEPLGDYTIHGMNGWGGRPGEALAPESFRRSIRHDADRYEILRLAAAERGLKIASCPGLSDPQHLTGRLGSLITDPQNHPEPGDSRLGLALHGFQASFGARLIPARRLMLAAWFLAVGVMPRSYAAKLLAWRLDPASRPANLKSIMTAVRRWTLR